MGEWDTSSASAPRSSLWLTPSWPRRRVPLRPAVPSSPTAHRKGEHHEIQHHRHHPGGGPKRLHATKAGGSGAENKLRPTKGRLVVDMRYDLGRVYVRDVLTHEEYDRKSIEGTL